MSNITTIQVDQSAAPNSQTTSVARVSTIVQALNYAISHNLPNINIVVGIGDFSADVLNIPQNMVVQIQGPISGFCALGTINWTVSGGIVPRFPPVQSGLVLRNIATGDINIIDGTTPAILASLVMENVGVFPAGNITQLGVSVVDINISGISAAAQNVTGFFVSSQIVGNIIVPSANIAFNQTLIDGYIICSNLFANGCSFDGYNIWDLSNDDTINAAIGITGYQCQINNSTAFGNIISNSVNVLFLNKNNLDPGTFYIDSYTNSQNPLAVNFDGSVVSPIILVKTPVDKIIPGTPGQIIITDTTPLATWATLSGDATITPEGVISNLSAQGLSNNSTVVSVAGAAAPMLDQILTATSSTTAIWQTPNGITLTQHETLRQLIHFIDEGPGDGFTSGAYKEITPFGSILPTSIIWYLNNTKTQKLIEKLIIWSGVVPIRITWNIYNIDGVTIAHTIVDNFTYVNNIFETTRTRTII